jgi:competence protein ComEA
VADAVQAAGGTTPEAALIRINLARLLSDGEQVVIPGPDDPVPPEANGAGGTGAGTIPGPGTGAASGVVDLNTATEGQLDALPGIGPVLAGRIVQWRTEHGRFAGVDQLCEVKGIGETLLARLRPLVRV